MMNPEILKRGKTKLLNYMTYEAAAIGSSAAQTLEEYDKFGWDPTEDFSRKWLETQIRIAEKIYLGAEDELNRMFGIDKKTGRSIPDTSDPFSEEEYYYFSRS